MYPIRTKKLLRYIKHLPGLIGYYPLNDFTGTTVRNFAPLNIGTNDGTIVSATLAQDGILGKSFSFDGISDSVTFPLTVPTTQLSFGFLYKRNGTNDVNDRIVDWSDAGPSGGFNILHPSGAADKVGFNIFNTAANEATILSDNNLSDSVWYLITGTYLQHSAKLYINGVQNGSTDTSVTMTSTSQTLRIMRRATATTNFTKGSVQHFFICNTVLTDNQILRLAQVAGLI